MSFLLRQVAHCDVCGHEWLSKKVPSHCAKCKSRKWNRPKDILEQAIESAPEGTIAVELRGGPPDYPLVERRPVHAKTCKCLMCKPPK